MISFGIRRLAYWIMHPRICKNDQNEWINSQNEWKIPKIFRAARKYIYHFPFIFFYFSNIKLWNGKLDFPFHGK